MSEADQLTLMHLLQSSHIPMGDGNHATRPFDALVRPAAGHRHGTSTGQKQSQDRHLVDSNVHSDGLILVVVQRGDLSTPDTLTTQVTQKAQLIS